LPFQMWRFGEEIALHSLLAAGKRLDDREAGGFVWTYMGPPEEMREFDPPAFAPAPDVRVSATKVRVRCNWAQILEGQIDSAHSSHLHSSDMVPAQVDGAKATEANWLRPSTDKAPRFQIERTSYGFRYAAIRRPIKNEETHDYIRTTVYIAPYTALIPPNNVHNVATLLTPEDDTNTIFYFIAWNGPDKPGIDAEALPPRSPPVAFDAEGLMPGKVHGADGMGVATDAGTGSNANARKVVVKLVVDKGVSGGG